MVTLGTVGLRQVQVRGSRSRIRVCGTYSTGYGFDYAYDNAKIR